MTGWAPHWPTVFVSIFSVFMVTFMKGLAEQLVTKLFKSKDKTDEPK